MLDFAFFARAKTAADVQYFTAWDGIGNMWNVWNKPRGRTMAHIICTGGGGGGGSGTTGGQFGHRGGGGGGGSGATSRLLIPLLFLPNTLFIRCGLSQNGAGGSTFVSTTQTNSTANLILSAAGGSVGGNGAVGVGGAGGNGGSISANTVAPFLGWGIFNSVAGQAGAAGGTNAAPGSNVALGGASPLSGGAGGAGVSSVGTPAAGGDITGNLPFPSIIGGAAGLAGTAGIEFQFPFLQCGGSGGGSADAAVGGAGGRPVRGCGGGGGGGGTTGGTGAPGGSGQAWIICF